MPLSLKYKCYDCLCVAVQNKAKQKQKKKQQTIATTVLISWQMDYVNLYFENAKKPIYVYSILIPTLNYPLAQTKYNLLQ